MNSTKKKSTTKTPTNHNTAKTTKKGLGAHTGTRAGEGAQSWWQTHSWNGWN